MDARELTFKGENEPVLYACGKCGIVHSPKVYACKGEAAHVAARAAAEACCVPSTCSVCGVGVDKYWTMCSTHALQARLRRAVRVERDSWHDPVCSADYEGDWGDGYSSDIGALLMWCDDESKDAPVFCYPCKPTYLRLDPDTMLQHVTDDMHEEASDQVVDADGLYDFIAAWNAKQTCVSWYPDHARVIVLDEERFAALLDDNAAIIAANKESER